MGELQERRSEIMMQAEKERHAEFIAFQREQAELNTQHELKMLEIIMKHSNPASSELKVVQCEKLQSTLTKYTSDMKGHMLMPLK